MLLRSASNRWSVENERLFVAVVTGNVANKWNSTWMFEKNTIGMSPWGLTRSSEFGLLAQGLWEGGPAGRPTLFRGPTAISNVAFYINRAWFQPRRNGSSIDRSPSMMKHCFVGSAVRWCTQGTNRVKRIWQGILPESQRELPGLHITFHIVPLNFSHCPFPLGLKLVVRLVATPCEYNQDFRSWDWKDDRRSEWMYEHIPKIENSCVKHWMTVFAVISEQGKAKRYLEYSSTTVRKYLLLEALGNGPFGPLKSKFSRSNTCVALISRSSFERTKCGFVCWHSSHWEVISRMSVRENERFLVRTKWPIRVTPGWQSNLKIAQVVLLNITTLSSS